MRIRRTRWKCGHCGSEGWSTPALDGSRDHDRPDGDDGFRTALHREITLVFGAGERLVRVLTQAAEFDYAELVA